MEVASRARPAGTDLQCSLFPRRGRSDPITPRSPETTEASQIKGRLEKTELRVRYGVIVGHVSFLSRSVVIVRRGVGCVVARAALAGLPRRFRV